MKTSSIAWIVLAMQFVLSLSAAANGNENAGATIDFSRDILPILSDKCFVCHGPDTIDPSSLRLDSFDRASEDRGGYQAIDPDHPSQSVVLHRIDSADDPMPPEDAEKQLSSTEKQLLHQWIMQGGQYTQHWAFVAPRRRLPAEHNDPTSRSSYTASSYTAIDAFIAAGHASRSIGFAKPADSATLARRASLVLCGLPPEPDELNDFLRDTRKDAYLRYVDKLLAKTSFGEHQARHWLDAVRYGDTHGLHLDNRRGVFPYRDWVVMAFNQNLPLNDFIEWQLAGDLHLDPTLQQMVATGYVRMNPTSGEGGAIEAEYQAKNNFDRTENLGSIMLGLTLTCARCHTHKYDPVLQSEYYQLLAFFNSTAEPALDQNKYDYGPHAKAPSNPSQWAQWLSYEESAQQLIRAAASLRPGTDSNADPQTANWDGLSTRQKLTAIADPAGPFATLAVHADAIALTNKWSVLEEQATTSLVAQELPVNRLTHLLRRGEYDLPTGDPLPPGVPAILGDLPADAPRNRLGLAKWLTSPEHPTVSRVLVNRLWQQTFGHGLVRTPEDFGLQGQYPTHPDLLDWLAVELQESGWDLKHMLRMMVTSQTFCQNSAWRPDIDDPENLWWARGPRFRLDAEVIRDVGLWASDLIDPEMGGEGVKPYQPDGMWEALAHPASNTKSYERDQGRRLYRRSLYVYWKRTSPHPMMTLFDAPDRETSCVRRSRTSTALQSLAMLNETQRIEMAKMLAQRILDARPDRDGRLDLMFRLLASRPPFTAESSACDQLLDKLLTRYRQHPEHASALLACGEMSIDGQLDLAEYAAWTQVALTVMASDVAILVY